ncbi:MAG: hypothetical protein ACR652_05015 [Methylocystis sp.]|uniref:hypothetical protein n=1 Tax=Methylocystis sp. TaxID=1911079 RepID=UPI003DA2CD57
MSLPFECAQPKAAVWAGDHFRPTERPYTALPLSRNDDNTLVTLFRRHCGAVVRRMRANAFLNL